jgi:hypothetical protein
LKYEKQLRNLQIQESRLHRRYTAELKELRDLQRERTERDKAAREDHPHADRPRTETPRAAAPAPRREREFEFSTQSSRAQTAPDTTSTNLSELSEARQAAA